jgi:hypothetical protein
LAKKIIFTFQKKIIYNFMIFLAKKIGGPTKISPSSAVVESEIRDPGWVKIRIRDPG